MVRQSDLPRLVIQIYNQKFLFQYGYDRLYRFVKSGVRFMVCRACVGFF